MAQIANFEKTRRDDEQAVYQWLHGEYTTEKALTQKLEGELEAANRHIACASALGPAAAIEQRYVHKPTMIDFEHEEAMKSEVSTCRAKVTQAESAYDRVKVEMHSLSASSESIQESLMKRLAHQESEQRLVLDAYRADRLLFDAQKRENVELRQQLRSALDVRAVVKPAPPWLPFAPEGCFPDIPGLDPIGIALEKVRAENIARQGHVSDAPPGLGALPRAAGMTQASLKASLSRYLAPPIPPPGGGGPPHDSGSVGRTSRSADAPGRPSRLAGGHERVGVGPPGGDPPDGGNDPGHGSDDDSGFDDPG